MSHLKAYLSKQEYQELLKYKASTKEWEDGKTEDYMQLCHFLNFSNWEDYENFPDWRKVQARSILDDKSFDDDSFISSLEYIFYRAIRKALRGLL